MHGGTRQEDKDEVIGSSKDAKQLQVCVLGMCVEMCVTICLDVSTDQCIMAIDTLYIYIRHVYRCVLDTCTDVY